MLHGPLDGFDVRAEAGALTFACRFASSLAYPDLRALRRAR
jgi:hypothetical protein